MKPESGAFLRQADVLLTRADTTPSAGLNEDAARTAYLACFHVAQAFIYERTEKTAKTHHGVQTEFFRLSRGNKRADPELRRFLSEAYEFKSVADYGTGPGAVTSATDADQAVTTAKRFVDAFGALVSDADTDRPTRNGTD